MRGKPRDKLSWFADLSWLYQSLAARGALEERFRGEGGYIRFHAELNAGLFCYAPNLWAEESRGVKTVVTEEGPRRVTEHQTPVGSVRQVETYLPESYTYAIREHFVKTTDDVRVMLYMRERAVCRADYAPYIKATGLWERFGYPVGISPLGVAPLQRMLTRWAGVETTTMLLNDEPEECRALFDAISDADDAIFDILCASPCMLIEFADNLSSEITGVKNFVEWNAPVYEKRIGALHKAGKLVSIHIDGTLRGCLRLLSPCGFDAAEAVTPIPSGDVPLEALREEAGDALVIWGGMPGAIFSPLFGEEQFERHLESVCEIFASDPKFIVGVADQVPPDGILRRVARVAEAIDETGMKLNCLRI